ncbi:hypothetical protein CLOM_g11151, partial [Closterium sp. NIES-68]
LRAAAEISSAGGIFEGAGKSTNCKRAVENADVGDCRMTCFRVMEMITSTTLLGSTVKKPLVKRAFLY